MKVVAIAVTFFYAVRLKIIANSITA